MIAIDRGVEPPGLRAARERRLPAAVAAFAKHGAPSASLKATLDGYSQSTKDALFLAQHKKCAWCEFTVHFSSSPVEHYRPKDGAWRHERGQASHVDGERYWWLTWTWENLLFSCARCNDQGHKANYFPLEAGTRPLPTPPRRAAQVRPSLFSVDRERPLLIDPTREDPLDHIQWVPVQRPKNRGNWTWMPRGLSPHGWRTIDILKLDELCDHAQHHLKREVVPSIEEIDGHLVARRIPQARSRWSALLRTVLDPSAPLSAVSYWALQIWIPDATRRRHRLVTPPRPGARPS